YLINGITKWIHGWTKSGWKTKEKKDVENRDLWERLFAMSRDKDIQWKQVEGHAGIAGNQRCDEIATAFADGKPVQLYSGVLKHYGIKDILEIPQGLTFLPTQGQTLKSPTAKRRSRTAAYSYVSLVDGVIQTHKTWAECEKRVKGKPARYKKVLSAEEEKELVAEWSK
ncbi:MAG: RNase H family protein, partial [Patescibacteria group bacterium]